MKFIERFGLLSGYVCWKGIPDRDCFCCKRYLIRTKECTSDAATILTGSQPRNTRNCWSWSWLKIHVAGLLDCLAYDIITNIVIYLDFRVHTTTLQFTFQIKHLQAKLEKITLWLSIAFCCCYFGCCLSRNVFLKIKALGTHCSTNTNWVTVFGTYDDFW